jgi:hypothetical protein
MVASPPSYHEAPPLSVDPCPYTLEFQNSECKGQKLNVKNKSIKYSPF